MPKLLARKACMSKRVTQAAAQALWDDGKLLLHVLPTSGVSWEQWSTLIGAKYSNALAALGEAMGCVMVQSTGEPSMQMTLNTFHLPGAGANVTLGNPCFFNPASSQSTRFKKLIPSTEATGDPRSTPSKSHDDHEHFDGRYYLPADPTAHNK